jgi:invasion protein IalB
MPHASSPVSLRARLVFKLGALLAVVVMPAAAQQTGTEQKTAPAAAVATSPELTTATFGSWVLRCQAAKDNASARQCEIVQSIQAQGQNAPLAQYGLTRANNPGQWRIVALLPVNVQFPSAVKISTGGKPPLGADLVWQRCVAIGCAAAGDLAADVLAAMRNATEPGTITFVDAAGRNIVLPIEYRGLTQAMDAFDK